jgi:hypothetical protein
MAGGIISSCHQAGFGWWHHVFVTGGINPSWLGSSICRWVNFAAVALVAEPLRPFVGRCVERPADVSGGAALCLLLRGCVYRSAVVSFAAPLGRFLCRCVQRRGVVVVGASYTCRIGRGGLLVVATFLRVCV